MSWQRREDDALERAAATSKKELVTPRGLQIVQSDLVCRLGSKMPGRCGWHGTWQPKHMGLSLRGQDYSREDRCCPLCKAPLARHHPLTLGTGNPVLGIRGRIQINGRKRERHVLTVP